MKALGLALIAVVAIGCSSTPTAPSSTAAQVATLAEQDARHPHQPGTQQVPVYFFSDDIGHGGNVHVTGLQVTLTGQPSGESVTAPTGKQGSVTIDVPRSDTRVSYITVEADGWCSVSGEIQLPYSMRSNWILVHKECS